MVRHHKTAADTDFRTAADIGVRVVSLCIRCRCLWQRTDMVLCLLSYLCFNVGVGLGLNRLNR